MTQPKSHSRRSMMSPLNENRVSCVQKPRWCLWLFGFQAPYEDVSGSRASVLHCLPSSTSAMPSLTIKWAALALVQWRTSGAQSHWDSFAVALAQLNWWYTWRGPAKRHWNHLHALAHLIFAQARWRGPLIEPFIHIWASTAHDKCHIHNTPWTQRPRNLLAS